MKEITFEQYRTIDLTIWAVLTMLFEAIATAAAARWFVSQPVALSITLTMVCIVMLRWGAESAISAVLGAFVYCMVSGAGIQQYFIYLLGNLFSLTALIVIKVLGREKIRNSVGCLFLFTITAYIGMAFGRGMVSLFFGGSIRTFIVYASTDIISLLFSVVILTILRKTDGMLEEQKAYLLRVAREKEENAEMNIVRTEEWTYENESR